MNEKPKVRAATPLRNTILYFLCIIGVSAVIAVVGIFLANDVFALAKPDKKITVSIPADASAGKIASLLDESGVVNSGLCFRAFAFVAYHDATYRTGKLTLNSDMDYKELMGKIRLTSQSTVTITIPEGYTVEEIVNLFTENGLSSEKELYDALQNGKFEYDFLPDDLGHKKNRLEGYLFPDTYEFYLSNDAESIIDKLLANFDTKFNSEVDGETLAQLCSEEGVSVEEMVNIASMIQKEAASNEEMPSISGVIHNRLDNSRDFPYLNIDAALEYAVGHSPLTSKDLDSDNEYNTYKHRGLPPGPICNPGYDALKAAVDPKSHNYYYYVANAQGTAHLFSSTLEEQNENIAKVQAEKEKS